MTEAMYSRLFAVLLVVLIAGCDDGIDKGVVIEKEFSPAHSYPCSRTIPMGKSIMVLPSTCWVGDQYTLYVQGRNSDGKPVIEDVTVDADNYNHYAKGDSIRFISK